MNSGAIATVLAVAGAVLGGGGLWAYLQSRRTYSGQVATTPAEILWQQNQQFLAAVQAERDKAVEQRDKLLDTVGTIGPTLASINLSLQKLLELSASGGRSPET
jgi:hypothetical protein